MQDLDKLIENVAFAQLCLSHKNINMTELRVLYQVQALQCNEQMKILE